MTYKPKPSVTIGLIQQSNGPDTGANLAQTLSRIEQASDYGAQIICLQELFHTEYFCQQEDEANFELAETIDGPLLEQMSEVAASNDVVIIVPFFERRAAGLFHNTVVIFNTDGSEIGRYRKMHIPDDPQFMEKYYFTPGDNGYPCFDTPFARIGVGICWDQWYPEAARLFALDGAEIIFYPTAIGWIAGDSVPVREAQHSAWLTMQRSHAIANGCFVAATNRVGIETSSTGSQIEFYGSSFVVDPAGNKVASASASESEVLLATIDLEEIQKQRIAWPFLRDRRVDSYSDLGRRYIHKS